MQNRKFASPRASGRRPLAPAASLAVVVLAGCAADPVELQVGTRALPQSEVNAYYQDEVSRAAVNSTPITREDFVPVLSRRLQLVEEGRRRGLDEDPRVEARRRAEWKAAVLRYMAPEVIDTDVQYSRDEVEEAFLRANTERRARHVIVKTEAEAREVMSRLQGGMSFEEAVRKFSLPGPAKSDDGDLGWSRKGRMVAPVDELIFRNPVGSRPEVVRTQAGYHVIEVTGERVVRCPDTRREEGESDGAFEKRCDQAFESVLDEFAEKMVSDELSRREQVYLTAVVNQVDIVWNEPIVDRIVGVARDEWSDPGVLMKSFGPDTAEVLVEANGEVFSLGWCLAEYAAYDPVRRPQMNTTTAAENFMRSLVIEEFMYRDGVDRDVDDKPEVSIAAHRGAERLIARLARDEMMGEPVAPTQEAVDAYFHSNRGEFWVPERVMIGEITSPYKERVEMADSLLAAGAPFKAVAMKVSVGVTARYGGALGPFKESRRPNRWAQVDTLEIGERTPPFEDGELWTIVELRKRLPAHEQAIEKARMTIHERLMQEQRDGVEVRFQDELNRLQPVEWNRP